MSSDFAILRTEDIAQRMDGEGRKREFLTHAVAVTQ